MNIFVIRHINKRNKIDHLKKNKYTIWAAAVDSHLDEHSYIVPGLGDAGDLSYGEKIVR